MTWVNSIKSKHPILRWIGILASVVGILGFFWTIFDIPSLPTAFTRDPYKIANKQLSVEKNEKTSVAFKIKDFEDNFAVFAVYSGADDPNAFHAFVVTQCKQRSNINQMIPIGNQSLMKIHSSDYNNDGFIELIFFGQASEPYFMLFFWDEVVKGYIRDDLTELLCDVYLASANEEIRKSIRNPKQYLTIIRKALSF